MSGSGGSSGSGVPAASDAGPGKEVLYANAGLSLNVFDLNPSTGVLTSKSSLTTPLPELLQFAAFDTTMTHFYAGIGAAADPAQYLNAFSVDPASGGLSLIGSVVDGGALDGGPTQGVLSPNGRVINLTLSRDNQYLLTVHNVTKAFTVFKLNADGTVGAIVPQADGGDMKVGAFLHQVRVDPTNQYVTICDRGNDPTPITTADGGMAIKPEDLGHLLTFSYSNGVLTPLQQITFPSGVGPRHLDFHPDFAHKPWVYLSAERGNRLITYSLTNGVLTQLFNTTSVANAADGVATNNQEIINGQRAGAIMVHPSGKFLWLANRNYALTPYVPDGGPGDGGAAGEAGANDSAAGETGLNDSTAPAGDASASASDAAAADVASSSEAGAAPASPLQVFLGTGENNVALFAIDQNTGQPTFVAATDSHGFEPRTFALDPSGQWLIVGNQKKINTLTSAGSVVTVMPNLSVFQVAADGKLTFVQSYDQSGEVWWVGGRAVTGP